MFDNGGSSLKVGAVTVATTQNTGLSVEYWADRCLDKILYVANDSASPIKDQALAFQDDLIKVIAYYMVQAVKSDRTTLYNLLLQQGEGEMAAMLLKLSGDR